MRNIALSIVVALVVIILFATNPNQNLGLASQKRTLTRPACHRPRIIPRFLTAKECQAVMDTALKQGLSRSEVVGTDDNEVSDVRTSWQVHLDQSHPAVARVFSKAEKLFGIHRTLFESLQVARYTEGQEYQTHFDSDDETPAHELRSDTLLIYLNDVDEGGSTHFPKVNVSVSPTTGKAVHWKNLDDRGRVLPCASHGSQPVISGEKWICTVWVNPFEKEKETRRPYGIKK